MRPRPALAPSLVALLLAALPTPSLGDEPSPGSPPFTPLFNGRDLDGWYTFLQKHGKDADPDHVITIEDGAIHLYKDTPEGSNVVMGYIATEKEFGDYHLRFQYRWGSKKFAPRMALKRDAGFYYHIQGADRVWPRALQYQIQQTDVGDLITLDFLLADSWAEPSTVDSIQTKDVGCPRFQDPAQGGAPLVLGTKGVAYQSHLAGDHERDGWNTAEVIAKGDSVTHVLNGTVVNRAEHVRLADPSQPGPPRPITRGRVALEIEAAELWFRDVEIRTLATDNPPSP